MYTAISVILYDFLFRLLNWVIFGYYAIRLFCISVILCVRLYGFRLYCFGYFVFRLIVFRLFDAMRIRDERLLTTRGPHL